MTWLVAPLPVIIPPRLVQARYSRVAVAGTCEVVPLRPTASTRLVGIGVSKSRLKSSSNPQVPVGPRPMREGVINPSLFGSISHRGQVPTQRAGFDFGTRPRVAGQKEVNMSVSCIRDWPGENAGQHTLALDQETQSAPKQQSARVHGISMYPTPATLATNNAHKCRGIAGPKKGPRIAHRAVYCGK